MTAGNRIRWWAAIFAAAVVLLWLLGESLTPFLTGAAIAYFLDPLVDRLENRKVRRSLGAFLVMGLAFLFVAAVFLLLVPVLLSQTSGLIDRLPALITQLRAFLASLAESEISGEFGAFLAAEIADSLRAAGPSAGTSTLKAALAGGVALIDAVAFAVVSPVVGYYLLVDWDRAVSHVDGLIPRDLVETVRKMASDIDRVLAAFVRGQVLVCTILAAFYAIALSVVGLEYAAVIGLAAGLVSFIPYVGTGIGFGVATGVALFQYYPEFSPIAAVVAIFAAGQVAESYYLSPRLVGRNVGLHPVWLLFALIAGGNLFGFAGLLVAVPVVASIGVLVRYAEDQYRRGRFYRYESSNGKRKSGERSATPPPEA